MSKETKRANRRNVSVEKLQKYFLKVLSEMANGSGSLSVREGNKGIVIYVENGGTLNFTYNEEGGQK